METSDNRVPKGSNRFDYAEHLLSRHPAITEDEVEDLKRWFNKEASAFEVASLASKERIHAGYTAFRADHIDGIKARDGSVRANAPAGKEMRAGRRNASSSQARQPVSLLQLLA